MQIAWRSCFTGRKEMMRRLPYIYTRVHGSLNNILLNAVYINDAMPVAKFVVMTYHLHMLRMLHTLHT